MQYYQFIKQSYETIKEARKTITTKNFCAQQMSVPKNPCNLYFQLFAVHNKLRVKVQQWNFKCIHSLVKSEYEVEEDSQLDLVQMIKKSYFPTLREFISKFCPKQRLQNIQHNQIELKIVNNQKDLKVFNESKLFFIPVHEYEGYGFDCSVSIETIFRQVHSNNLQIDPSIDDDQQFEVLVDSTQQRKQQKNRNQLNESNSQKIVRAEIEIQQQKNRIDSVKIIQKKGLMLSEEMEGNTNLFLSKYSTKQITITQSQAKNELINQTLEMIKKLEFNQKQSVANFLKQLN